MIEIAKIIGVFGIIFGSVALYFACKLVWMIAQIPRLQELKWEYEHGIEMAKRKRETDHDKMMKVIERARA